MGLSLGLVRSPLTQQPAVSHTASRPSPGGQLSARTAETGSRDGAQPQPGRLPQSSVTVSMGSCLLFYLSHFSNYTMLSEGHSS